MLCDRTYISDLPLLFGTLENSEGSEWNFYECFVVEPSSLTYLCSLVHWKTAKASSQLYKNAL